MYKYVLCVGTLCLVLAGCGSHQSALTQNPASRGGSTPLVVQTGKAPVQWTQFNWGDTLANPHQYDSVVIGLDHNMWYTDYNGQALIKMGMNGATHAYPLIYNGTTHYFPSSIVMGSDGKLYMDSPNLAGFIGISTANGVFSVKAIPSNDYGYVGGMTRGPDGNVWFTELAHVAKITPGGVITEFPYNDGNTANYYGSATVGADGDVWVTEYNAQVIDDIEPTTGAMTSYVLPCTPYGVVSAGDGNLYVNCSQQLVRVTTSGSTSSIFNPFNTITYPSSFTRGGDGNPWWTVSGSNEIASYNTTANSLTVLFPPTGFSADYGISAGPDGNIWALDTLGKTDIYILHVLSVSPKTLTFTGHPQTQNITVTEPGTTAWTAVSSNTGVATVVQGTPANVFKVTSVAHGTCNITVSAMFNSFVVKVTVP